MMEAIDVMHEYLSVTFLPEFKGKNLQAKFCRSMLDHDGLKLLQHLHETHPEEIIRNNAYSLLCKTVPLIWSS